MKIPLLISLLVIYAGAAEAASLEILNPKVQQGEIVVIRVEPQWQPVAVGVPVCVLIKWDLLDLNSGETSRQEYRSNHQGRVVVGVPMHAKPQKYPLTLIPCGDASVLDWYAGELEVTEASFLKTRKSRYTHPPVSRNDKQAMNIQDAFNSVFSSRSSDLADSIWFVDPLSVARDAIDNYGFIYENNPYRRHQGVDLRASSGTPVRAINGGRIIFLARNYRAEGNMIILDHGLGIVSVYMHLSRFSVKVGDVVRQKQIIGHTGTTGAGARRDPHLHLNIRVNDFYVDPLRFIDTINQYIPNFIK